MNQSVPFGDACFYCILPAHRRCFSGAHTFSLKNVIFSKPGPSDRGCSSVVGIVNEQLD